jgi:glucokinase
VALGIDLGGTKTAFAVYSLRSGILFTELQSTRMLATPDETLIAAVDQALCVAATHGIETSRVQAMGLGLAGLINASGVFLNSIILPHWHDVDAATIVRRHLPIAVRVENDATMAAYAHFDGLSISRPAALACLTLGTGVGAAVLLDGSPLRGPDGTAAQLGHWSLDPNGPACECGGVGCLNVYASGTAISSRYAALHDGEQIAAREVAHRARAGDSTAVSVLTDAGRYLGLALAGVVNVFNPDVIALGGSVVLSGSFLLSGARETMTRRAFTTPAQRVELKISQNPSLDGAIGAAKAAVIR